MQDYIFLELKLATNFWIDAVICLIKQYKDVAPNILFGHDPVLKKTNGCWNTSKVNQKQRLAWRNQKSITFIPNKGYENDFNKILIRWNRF